MHFIFDVFYLTLVSITVAASSHDVLVGNAGLVYSPNSTTAAVGDTVVFHFYPGNHNVVQGAFNQPCSTSGGFYSGFIDSQSGASGNTFTITINDTNPIWIYCSQAEHCQLGMVAVINPPSSGDTLAAYAASSAKTSKSTTPNNVEGGVIGPASGSGSSSSSSAPSNSVAGSSSSSSASPSSSSISSANPSSSTGSAGSSSASLTSASSSAARTSSTVTSSTTSPSASATGNSAAVLEENKLLSGAMTILASLALWAGLL